MEPSRDSATSSRATGAGLKETIERDGRAKIESGKRAAADHMDEIADAIDVAGAELDRSQPGVAGYASRLADGVANLATRLRDGSIEDLTRDARQLAKRNPAMFLMGGAALGIVVARFLKASGEQGSDTEDDSDLAGPGSQTDAGLPGADTGASALEAFGEREGDSDADRSTGNNRPLRESLDAAHIEGG